MTLKKPFPGSNLTQVSHRIAYDPYIPVRETRSDCPEEFHRVLERALAKEPAKRYSSAAGMAEDLTRYLERGPQKPAIEPSDVTMIMKDQPAAKSVAVESQSTLIYSGPAPARPSAPPSVAAEGGPAPTVPSKPAASDKKASPAAPGARKRFIAWIAAHKKLEILSYPVYFRWVLAIVGAWAVLWAVILGVLYVKARAQTPVRNASTYGDRAIAWRKDMQKGMRLLQAGNGTEASSLFQSVLVQIPDSPALRMLEKEALRRQDMEISTQSASKRLGYYLGAGEDAFNRRDMGTAREYFQQALQVDPDNAVAKGYLQKIQSRAPAPRGAGLCPHPKPRWRPKPRRPPPGRPSRRPRPSPAPSPPYGCGS